ncbi:hypothetical protein BO71DRAFT_411454 [Aspergillus ellipticus CBS 707.79]|uniref:Uncharacterized protein n=1 Tax=Aspergillus ellipticus CBS 707.79 TaxID=1448320 RepID=A0A319DKU6_9EURO|nr:hypothetical protein BO71DRAFT_411454 [Aspergillus ellipticus CBS 707.79]
MPSRWFARGEVGPDTIVELNKKWIILETINEQVFQTHEQSPPNSTSFACTRLLCTEAETGMQAHMRIYKQIPIEGTEAEPAAIRAQQASSCYPRELKALHTLTQKRSVITPRLLDSKNDRQESTGLVPGGFVLWVVWELLPGIRLGNHLGGSKFWDMERTQRDTIREAFKEGIMKLYLWGYYPHFGRCRSLVWNAQTSNLYFVGFFMANSVSRPETWSPAIWAEWGLARPPKSCHFWWPTWDGSTEGWEW